ncbi:MAG: histidinol dehydrogenase, partial [Proteobacteria bacterium]|nr:histidinol dehydrogenase [Pseudomonadota bacterium]
TPPRPDGTADPAVLVAASRSGVTEIYKVGGAQAIAAMAYGTETLPRVAKIFGPGNAWVTCAKSLVSADASGAAIDMPAGPSEVLVIADADASADFVASDLLAQAEHGADSQALLLTTSAALARDVESQLRSQLRRLSRAGIAGAALGKSCLLVVEDLATAIEISNAYAPEHLILQLGEPRKILGRIRNAGSVFVGPWTPESVGDYCSGTNHVLPTYGHARTYSGLGLEHFMRHMTIQELTREGLENLGGAVVTLAGLEGLDAHAASVTRRLGKPA